ncbi:type I restriction endonuclease subunit R, EcoR124 family [Mycoplasma struthionis]|uniref:type I restriction endonuclease subunit R, EcoR124 family n=1 Tax=Mycoplasma struthionis TaxID=538220 RepID=UPI001C98A7B0|nr:hypothetical protein [Mycoplasma struthionis]
MQNLLRSFDEYVDKKMQIIEDRDQQDYTSHYLNIREELIKKEKYDKEIVNDDIIFEVDLLRHSDIDVDYILNIVSYYRENNKEPKEIFFNLQSTIESSISLRSKKELIELFINNLNNYVGLNFDISDEWADFLKKQKKLELDKIIEKENLNKEATHKFMNSIFINNEFKRTGTEIDDIVIGQSFFWSKCWWIWRKK